MFYYYGDRKNGREFQESFQMEMQNFLSPNIRLYRNTLFPSPCGAMQIFATGERVITLLADNHTLLMLQNSMVIEFKLSCFSE